MLLLKWQSSLLLLLMWSFNAVGVSQTETARVEAFICGTYFWYDEGKIEWMEGSCYKEVQRRNNVPRFCKLFVEANDVCWRFV